MPFADPKKHIAQFDLAEGMRVADFGTGAGHYALTIAKVVGDEGRVVAIDVQKDLLLRLETEAHRARITNLETIWGDIDRVGGSKLADGSMDVVLASNVLFQIENKAAFIEEVYRVLNAGGRAIVICWSESFGNMGPRAEEVVSRDTTERLFGEHDFKLQREFDAGEHHYGLVFVKER